MKSIECVKDKTPTDPHKPIESTSTGATLPVENASTEARTPIERTPTGPRLSIQNVPTGAGKALPKTPEPAPKPSGRWSGNSLTDSGESTGRVINYDLRRRSTSISTANSFPISEESIISLASSNARKGKENEKFYFPMIDKKMYDQFELAKFNLLSTYIPVSKERPVNGMIYTRGFSNMSDEILKAFDFDIFPLDFKPIMLLYDPRVIDTTRLFLKRICTIRNRIEKHINDIEEKILILHEITPYASYIPLSISDSIDDKIILSTSMGIGTIKSTIIDKIRRSSKENRVH